MGGYIEIRSPVLLSIFQSEELMHAYKQDPHRKYSVNEILSMRNKSIPVQRPSIRRTIVDNTILFETTKEVQVIGKKGNKYVFEYIEKEWENQDKLDKEK